MSGPIEDGPRKGRGAVSNPAGRFESKHRQAFDDGWLTEDTELPPLKTTVISEPARSIIARNDSPDVGFSLSINPYKGCEHGCVYCLAGDTRILMANGRTKALEDVREGDHVYGTRQEGFYRRYRPSRVLAQWRTIKPAYRITLEDGTKLIAGPDHRFLTDRGWKFVTGTEQGANRRPFLTMSNKLMGVGKFAEGPVVDVAYRLGYLCGMVRGDGLLGEWHYRSRGRQDNIYQFRLALMDLEALARAKEYLEHFAIGTYEFQFAEAAGARSAMRAIRTSTRANVETIHELIRWPESPGSTWMAGFLAGIFDAEGGYNDGCIRISNTNPEIITWITRSLAAFGFQWKVENIVRERPIQVVRVTGGLKEHLRFFHTIGPAITRKMNIEGQAVKSAARLDVTNIEPLGRAMALYDIQTETEDFIANGVVSHNCFARPSHGYMNLSPGLDFETKLFYKPNAAELLEKELRKPGYECHSITLGANTDPYQPIENKLGITRSLLEVGLKYRQPMFIVTKGAAVVQRDVGLLAEMAKERLAAVAVSITTLRDDIKRTLEPRAASPQSRLRLVRSLTEAGVPTMVMVAPIIPFVTDHEMEAILEAARDAGALAAGYVMLRLPWEVKDLFDEWLRAHFPQKADHVMSLMRQIHGGDPQHRAAEPEGVAEEDASHESVPEKNAREPGQFKRNDYYSAEFHRRQKGEGPFAQMIEQRFRLACRRFKLDRMRQLALDTTQFRLPPATGDQFRMDF
jgi:DNA repair photolyase